MVPCMSVQEAPVTVDCVTDPLDSFLTTFPDVSVTPGVVTVGPDRSRVVVVLENHSDHPVLLAKDVNIAELSPVPEDFIVEDDDPTVSSVADTQPLVLSPECAEVIRTYVDSQSHLSVPEKNTLTEILPGRIMTCLSCRRVILVIVMFSHIVLVLVRQSQLSSLRVVYPTTTGRLYKLCWMICWPVV